MNGIYDALQGQGAVPTPPPPEQDPQIQNHPAIAAMRQLRATWERTGVQDPRIVAYQNAVAVAQKTGLDPHTAAIFAATAATGK